MAEYAGKKYDVMIDVSNDGTMVVPINFTQLKDSFVFKIIEKILF